jgi:hypothetical protein
MAAFFLASVTLTGMHRTTELSLDRECRNIDGLTAKDFYKKAFIASLDGDERSAETAAACSALLYRGDSHWPIDARSFLR